MKHLDSGLRLVIFAILAYLFFLIFRTFIPSFLVAVVFAMIFSPLVNFIKSVFRLKHEGSVLLTVVLTLVLIILPLIALLGLVGNEALQFAKSTDLESLRTQLSQISILDSVGFNLSDLQDKIISSLQSVGSLVSAKSFNIAASAGNSIFLFGVFLVFYYYFLKDGQGLLDSFQKMLPYSASQKKHLLQSFQAISRTVFFGNLASALAAGFIAYLGFFIFKVNTPLIWGLLAAILSFIPTAGTLFVYLVGFLILGFTSGWLLAVFFLLYYGLAEVLFRDNFLKGKIFEDKLNLHPVLVFIALVGGVTAFGSLGLIYGPLIVVLLGSIYQFHVLENS